MTTILSTPDLQHIWEVTKATLDLAASAPDESSVEEVCLALERSKKHPEVLHTALVHLMDTQHPYLGTAVFAGSLEDYVLTLLATDDFQNIEATMWSSMRVQEWDDPLRLTNFVQWMAPLELTSELHPNAWLEFLDKYPQLLGAVHNNIVYVGREYQYREDEDEQEKAKYFERAKAMLFPYPREYLALHQDMGQALELDAFERCTPHAHLYFDAVLGAYRQMPVGQRDTQQAERCFARLLMNVNDMDVHLYGNNYLKPEIASILQNQPHGAMGRLLVLHACTNALFPQYCDKTRVRKFNLMFKCDPTQPDDFAKLVNDYVPEYTEFFAVMKGLGLPRDAVWQQALARMVDTTMELSVSPNLFANEA